MKKNNVAILMSTYNGEKYISTQLDSLLTQKDVNLDIIIRDDGSKDNTINIIRQYQKTNPNITLIIGEKNLGYAYSFWNLVRTTSDEYDYYAFCDQDDIWDDNKIIKAIEMIDKYIETPCLYTSRVVSVNNDLEILNENTFPYNGVLNKYESFQKSVVPGCVFVFNNTAKKLLSLYNGYMESHDWAAYAIINSFGKVVYDDNSYIKYRIHNNNTIGKQSKIGNLKKKISRFFRKSKCSRSNFAKDFFNVYGLDVKDSYFKGSIKALAFYKNNIKYKVKLVFSNRFKGIVFKIYVILNRI